MARSANRCPKMNRWLFGKLSIRSRSHFTTSYHLTNTIGGFAGPAIQTTQIPKVGYAPDSSSDPWHEAEGQKAVIPSPFGCAERCRGISPRVFEGGWPADPACAPSPDLREERSLDFADAPLGMTLLSACREKTPDVVFSFQEAQNAARHAASACYGQMVIFEGKKDSGCLFGVQVAARICTTMPQNVAFLSTFSGVSVRNSFGAWDLRVRIPFGFRVWLRPRAERPRPRRVHLCQSVDGFFAMLDVRELRISGEVGRDFLRIFSGIVRPGCAGRERPGHSKNANPPVARVAFFGSGGQDATGSPFRQRMPAQRLAFLGAPTCPTVPSDWNRG